MERPIFDPEKNTALSAYLINDMITGPELSDQLEGIDRMRETISLMRQQGAPESHIQESLADLRQTYQIIEGLQ